MSMEKAKELGLTPLAKIKAVGYGGCDPSIMGLSPVPAVRSLMKRSGLKLEDFELIEVNEAFAAQYLGCEKELKINREITNVNGSGIGLGHPVGATGNRIMVTLIHAMKKRKRRWASPRCAAAGRFHRNGHRNAVIAPAAATGPSSGRKIMKDLKAKLPW